MINSAISFFLFVFLTLFHLCAQASTPITFIRKCDVQTTKDEHIVGWEIGWTWDTCRDSSLDITKSAIYDDQGYQYTDHEPIKLYQNLYQDLDYGSSLNNQGFTDPYMQFVAITLKEDYKVILRQEVKESTCNKCINLNKAPVLEVAEEELNLLRKPAYATFAVYDDFHVVTHLISYNSQYKTSKDLENLFLQLASKHSLENNEKVIIDIYGHLQNSNKIDFIAVKKDIPRNILFFEYSVAD